MEWTREPPTEPGWYWNRCGDYDEMPHPQYIYRNGDSLMLFDVALDAEVVACEYPGEWWPVPLEPPR